MQSKKYFEKNKERIQNNLKMLYDEESREVYLKCIKYRITHDYHDRPRYNRSNQYFPGDIINILGEGIMNFVDCGAYIGDTVRVFKKLTKNNYNKIVAFEPDHKNVEILRKSNRNIVIVAAAVFSKDTVLHFKMGDGDASKVSATGDMKVNAKAIDSVIECGDADFIKMDIEGSEFDALLGAKNTIFANKPILAICIYHSDEDMLRILELIGSWNLNYKFYIRHHGQKTRDTVLYAIP